MYTHIIKTSFSIMLFYFFSTQSAQAQQIIPDDKKETGKFCSMLKEGSMTLVKDGTVATKEITLRDGSKITKDGTVHRKDGSNVVLKNGECIDMDGNIENIPLEKMEQKNNLTDSD